MKYDKLLITKIEDKSTNGLLQIHLITFKIHLRSQDYTKTETKTVPKFGNLGEPIAELTTFG